MSFRSFQIAAAALLLTLVPGRVAAQDSLPSNPDQTLVDRVAAVVGDSAILVTEIEERLQQLRASGAQIPQDPVAVEQLRRDILQTLVNEQLVVQAAIKDTTISVTDQQVDQEVDREIDSRTNQFGGRNALTKALRDANLTMASYRQSLSNQIRRQMLLQQYMSRARQESSSTVKVTEDEMRQFFEAQRASLENRPASIEFTQVVLEPEPSDSANAAALARAKEIRQMAVSGQQDFETLAKRFSQDPGSAQKGGDLGWFRRGDMVPAFSDAAYAMRPGQISPVVKTSFGYHIIRLDRIRGAERKASHILIRPQVQDADLEKTQALAQDIVGQLRQGASIEELRSKYQTTHDVRDTVQVARDRLDQLPQGYADALKDAKEGQIVGPLRWDAGSGRARLSVLEVLEVREAGQFTFEDLRDQIESTLREQKLRDRILKGLRSGTYVEIRM